MHSNAMERYYDYMIRTLNLENFIEGTKLCLETTQIVFEGIYFSQICEIVMGSPISATIANVVMENVISKLDYSTSFHKRYAGDYLLCIPIDKLLDINTDTI